MIAASRNGTISVARAAPSPSAPPGTAAGYALGLLMGSSSLVRAALEPLLDALYVVPKLALLPVFLNMFGLGEGPQVALVAATVFFFVWISTMSAVIAIPSGHRDAGRVFGASPWQMFRHITYPLLTPIIAVVMTFSVLFTFTDFQLIWAMTRGGPVNATHLMATLSYQRAIIAGQLGEGAAIASAMIPFLLAAIMVSWFGLQRRKWQQGENND